MFRFPMLRGGNSSDEIPVDYLAYMDGRESYQPFSCVFCLWIEVPPYFKLLWGRIINRSFCLKLHGANLINYLRLKLTKARKLASQGAPCTNQLLYIENYFFTKQDTFMRRSTILSLPSQLVFPACTHHGTWQGSQCSFLVFTPGCKVRK